jgi:hypothetical protein
MMRNTKRRAIKIQRGEIQEGAEEFAAEFACEPDELEEPDELLLPKILNPLFAPLFFLAPLLLPKILNPLLVLDLAELALPELFEFTVFLFVGGGEELPKGIKLLKESAF